MASGAPYYHQVYKTSDLTPDGNYASDAYPNAVAIAPDGTVAAGIDGIYEPDVYVYEPGATTAAHVYDFTEHGGSTGARHARARRPGLGAGRAPACSR